MTTYLWQVWLCDPLGSLMLLAALFSPAVAVLLPMFLGWLVFWPPRVPKKASNEVCSAAAPIPDVVAQPANQPSVLVA